ncbi:MAG: hypothetical protein BMS9Abin24_020 [Thermodesulfobacteriota bacterium]|nr:MAG: hypothetical protein BMS9Abin24_020 [Thermodesulfobacteriota bacterium]
MKISINKKVMGLFSAVILLSLLAAAGFFYAIRSMQTTMREMDLVSKKISATGDLRFHVNKLLVVVSQYLATGDPDAIESFDLGVNEIIGLFNFIRSYEGSPRWKAVEKDVERLAIAYGEKGLDILYIEDPVGSAEGSKLVKELNALGETLMEKVEEFHSVSEDELTVMERTTARLTRITGVFALAVSGALLFFLWPLYYYLRRFLLDPIHQLHEGAAIIGTGELDHRLEIDTGDEFEDLAHEFNGMAASLEEAKKDLDKKILELYTLYNVSKVLSTSFEMEELLGRIIEKVSSGFHLDKVMIMLIDDKNDELYIGSHTDFVGKGLEGKRFKVGEGFYGTAARTGEAAIAAEVNNNPAIMAHEVFDAGVNSVMAAPFGAKGTTLGLLCAFKNKPEVFNGEDLKLLMTVSEHVALALENARLYRETKLMAITDGLTGLYNHRFFMKRLHEEVERTKRYGRPLSLIMLDIDFFKQYNDNNGHQMGDDLLRTIATLIKDNLRVMDFVARYGGEEFVILLSETGKQNALLTAEKVRRLVEDYPFPLQETQPEGNLTVSVGVASLNTDAADAEGLIKKADDAMYLAKDSGRNRVIGSAA